ncbi:putative cytochrome p450 protein [Rosellinia necatrix]|uniref:Putative cytochrome p450 protein n=1 Tax=Rosellinia necatrix TaxID=77044 RepID=A0A1W2TJ83_ROSNE|nr:putative cytochrome p450 protein [Rosellinia necatrix]
MAIHDWFDHAYKFRVHVVQVLLTILITVLAIAYIPTPGAIVTRIRIMVPIIGVKSLIIQAYQILTEHTTRFAKWKSPKANAILNCVEVLFWAAFTGLQFQTNAAICIGPACGLGWATALFSLVLLFLTLWMAVCTCLEFHLYRVSGKKGYGQKLPSDPEWER